MFNRSNVFTFLGCFLIGLTVVIGISKILEYSFIFSKNSEQIKKSEDISDQENTFLCNNYSFNQKAEGDNEEFNILCNQGKVVFSLESIGMSEYFWIITVDSSEGSKKLDAEEFIKNGQHRDLTGDGIDDIFIGIDSGGATGCCFNYYLLSLGEEFRKTTLRTSILKAEFVDIDKTGMIEIIIPDLSFSYDKNGGRGSVIPQEILELQNGEYTFSQKLMKRAKPKNYSTQIKNLRNKGVLSQEVEDYMTMLAYRGLGESVWELFNQLSVNTPNEDRENFKFWFLHNLEQSEFSKEIYEINGW